MDTIKEINARKAIVSWQVNRKTITFVLYLFLTNYTQSDITIHNNGPLANCAIAEATPQKSR